MFYLHSKEIRKPLKIAVANNLGREGEVILSPRSLRTIRAIPDVWLFKDELKFSN